MIYRFEWSKQQTYEAALKVVRDFIAINRLFPVPKFIVGVAPHTSNEWQTYGLYLPAGAVNEQPRIFVNVDKSTKPVKVRGRIWSFPGHKTDRTAAGILAHETGHHASRILAERLYRKTMVATNASELMQLSIGYYKPWQALLEKTKPITSYEPVPDEAFAETARLFILNPNLLRRGNPARYEFLTKELGLKPVVTYSWRKVLGSAPDFIYAAAEKYAGELGE